MSDPPQKSDKHNTALEALRTRIKAPTIFTVISLAVAIVTALTPLAVGLITLHGDVESLKARVKINDDKLEFVRDFLTSDCFGSKQ